MNALPPGQWVKLDRAGQAVSPDASPPASDQTRAVDTEETVSRHMQRQTDRMLMVIERMKRRMAEGKKLDVYSDFEELVGIRNSFVFLKDLVRERDFLPDDCRIATSPTGGLYPVAR